MLIPMVLPIDTKTIMTVQDLDIMPYTYVTSLVVRVAKTISPALD